MSAQKIVYFTNLYPLPWEPTRAAYNANIVMSLREHTEVDVLTPVPAPLWFKHVLLKQPKVAGQQFFPFFFIPGTGRRTYALSMFLSILICVFPLVKLARAKKIIASWAFPEGTVAALCKTLFGAKVAIHCVGTDINHHFQHAARRRQMIWAFDKADRVITVSRDLADKIRQHVSARTQIDVVYNGVSFNAFNVSPPAPIANHNLLFIGNLIRTKGVFELIDAIALLKNKGIHVHLTLIGKGPEKSALQAQATALKIDDQVTFTGPVLHKDIPPYLCRSRALILPSHREGVPNVIMEALAAGVPPIATAVGGIPEIINHGENGILIAEQTAQSVADAIELTLQKAWKPEQLRGSISAFTWENCAQGFLAALGE